MGNYKTYFGIKLIKNNFKSMSNKFNFKLSSKSNVGKKKIKNLVNSKALQDSWTHFGGRKWSLFCGTPAKKLQNLRPATCKFIILWLHF